MFQEGGRGLTAVGDLALDPAQSTARTQRPWGQRAADPTPGISLDLRDWLTQGFLSAAEVLARYHRHRVFHMSRLERLFREGRRVVIVGNHALDIVDPLLVFAKVYRRTGRAPHVIGHENGWFRVPLLREISRRFQVIPSRRPEETVAALRRGGFLMVYPGGLRESGMRNYRDEPYRLKWEGRMGFLRVALEADAEVVFLAAVGSDEAYYQSRLPTPRAIIRIGNAGDDRRYRGLRLGFGLAGPHLVPGVFPFPVQISHFFSPPLDLGDRERARRDPVTLEEIHERVWRDCQKFLNAAVSRRNRETDLLDRVVRSTQRVLQNVGV